MNIFTILTPAEQTVAACIVLFGLPISSWMYFFIRHLRQ